MLLALFFYMLVSQVYCQWYPGLLVNSTQGSILGTVGSDGDYFSFYGIPYAGSTAGDNRFKGPPPPPLFTETFNASDPTVICAQPSPEGPIGVEDCLRLNIFTRSATTSKPVLVWLIGEDYTTSNPLQYSFRNLVEKDLVVVSLNYRLSVFGFLCLGIEEAPGNAGLKDVIHGLKWIQENIAEFGGDPKNVALIGHGAAAAMVDLVTLSPLSHNLVHKVMVHSGSALAPWAVSHNPIHSAEMFVTSLGFNETEREEMAEFLKTTSAASLINAINDIKLLDNTYIFAPCIENVRLNPNDAFLTDAPINLLRSGEYNHVLYITGYTDVEGTLRLENALNHQWMEKMESNFTNFTPIDLDLDSEAVQLLKSFYFGDAIIDMSTLSEYLSYHGDTMILIPLLRGAIERTRTSRTEVRLFEFVYIRTVNYDWAYPGIDVEGVPHGGVLNFLLDFNLGFRDIMVMTSLIERYVAFLYTGVPTPPSTDVGSIIVPFWHMISTQNRYLSYGGGLVFNEPPVVWRFTRAQRRDPYVEKLAFWEELYAEHYVPPLSLTPSSAAYKTISVVLIILCQLLSV